MTTPIPNCPQGDEPIRERAWTDEQTGRVRIGSRVSTPDGAGSVVDIEHYSRIAGGINRYGVQLDEQRYDYPVAYYWPKDISTGATP